MIHDNDVATKLLTGTAEQDLDLGCLIKSAEGAINECRRPELPRRGEGGGACPPRNFELKFGILDSPEMHLNL